MNNANIRRLPFNEAIDFIQQKLLIPSRQYNDLIGPVHAKAFTVAGATKLQLLQDLYQAVQNSILDGTTITQFRKDFDEIVARHGWSYKGKRGWRTNVIFQTNKRTAYLAGHWAQFQRLKDRRPYLMYLTVDDSRVREEHRQWHRIVAHIDDPIWQQIFPPNGWLCRCIVRSLSQADVDRMGITVERLGRIETIDFTDPKTGEIIKKTPGIDVGWDYNVGESWLGPDA
ncbi:MAG: phage minor head protein, partial [Pseudomonadota bacterium]